MTDTELLAKIKAEIEKLYDKYKDKFHQCGDQYHLGLIDGLDMAERVLDTFEKSEKPMNQDGLEEEIERYLPNIPENPYNEELHVFARHFAKWGAEHAREQMMNGAVEGEITKDNRGNNVLRVGLLNNGFEIGDKVRIIVCKNED